MAEEPDPTTVIRPLPPRTRADTAELEPGVAEIAEGPLRLGRLARSTPLVVWLVTLAYAALAGFYLLAVPPLHAPDEVAHVDLILQQSDHVGLDPYDGLTYSSDIEAAIPLVGLVQVDWRVGPRPWGDGLGAGEIPGRGQRPSMTELGDGTATGVLNSARTHPPLYYALVDGGNLVAEQVLGPASWDAAVGRLRLVSLLLGLPLPMLAFWTAVRVDRRRRTGVLAALGILLAPQLAHSTGSVNNDVLLFPLTGLITLALAWVVTGDRSWRPAVVAGLATGLGALTKVFALGAPVWIVAAYLVAWRQGASLRTVAARLGGAAGVTLLAGGFWPLRAILRQGSVAPRGFGYPLVDVDPDVGWWLGEAARRLAVTGWGKFGVEQFALPAVAVVAATVAVAVWVTVGLAGRPVTGVLLLPVVTTLAMIGYAAWDGYVQSGLPTGLHGRYLFTGAVGLATAAAVGLRVAADRWGRVRPPHWLRGVDLAAVTVAVVGLQAVAAVLVTGAFWQGPGLVSSLQTMLVWAPVGRRLLAAVAVVVALGLVGLVVSLVREARRPEVLA